jgi:hypothetical protein
LLPQLFHVASMNRLPDFQPGQSVVVNRSHLSFSPTPASAGVRQFCARISGARMF